MSVERVTTEWVTTRWWLIRHAPVVNPAGVIIGSTDAAADTGDAATALALAAALPTGALWLTSPLRRSRQTARALRPESSPPRAADGTEPDLAEQDLAEQDFGMWEGQTHDAIAAADPDAAARFWADPATNAPPGGESFSALSTRVAGALTRWTAAHAGRDLVAVVHGGPIRAAVALALDLSPAAALRLRVDHWSLTRIDHHAPTGGRADHGSWSVGCVNQRFAPPGPPRSSAG